MSKITEDEWTALQAKYAGHELKRLDFVRSGTVVLREPTAVEYKMFSQEAFGGSAVDAYRNAILRTAVYPAPSDLLTKKPGFLSNKLLIAAVNDLSGVAEELEGKD